MQIRAFQFRHPLWKAPLRDRKGIRVHCKMALEGEESKSCLQLTTLVDNDPRSIIKTTWIPIQLTRHNQLNRHTSIHLLPKTSIIFPIPRSSRLTLTPQGKMDLQSQTQFHCSYQYPSHHSKSIIIHKERGTESNIITIRYRYKEKGFIRWQIQSWVSSSVC